jgi:TonB family protein
MNTFKPTLMFNCPESWGKMKVGLVSRYCDNCKKDVQDFTKLTREEILHFLLLNRNDKVCGRIYKSQLDYHPEDILIAIDPYIHKHKKSNLSFYLLAIGALTLLNCSTKDIKKNQAIDSLTFSISKQHKNSNESNKYENPICKTDSLLPDEVELVGAIMLVDSLDTESLGSQLGSDVRLIAEVMPEFAGGFDSLYSYIRKNLKYPEWEKKEKIEGNVFVTFVIAADGKIKDPKILRSVDGSKNFDKEVLRVIEEMPTWKPGQEHGQNVAVQFTIPIRFRL